MSARLLVAILAVAAVLACIGPAWGVERTVAGSAQLDYHFVPTEPNANGNAGTLNVFDGFTMEAALKLAVDISDHLSANVKVCYGCHGFEVDMAYFDLRAADELNVRVGRFSPSFGAFNLRHDPANHKLSDKPLPYDMGRMLRKNDWNSSVLPSPFPNNGIELNGTHFLGESAQLDYAAYGVAGFRNAAGIAEYAGTAANPLDVDFAESHLPYYVDNNARPTGGARLAFTWRPGSATDVTLGASGMAGTYDDQNKLLYAILGGDLSVRVLRTNLRLEYLVRRTEFSTSDPSELKYVVARSQGDYFVKHGAYAELEQPITSVFDFIARVDGMYRVGNVATESTLSNKSSVLRETLGFAFAVERNLRLKTSGEYWQFSDPDVNGHRDEVSLHVGVVGTF